MIRDDGETSQQMMMIMMLIMMVMTRKAFMLESESFEDGESTKPCGRRGKGGVGFKR
jgi:hypothetical protein